MKIIYKMPEILNLYMANFCLKLCKGCLDWPRPLSSLQAFFRLSHRTVKFVKVLLAKVKGRTMLMNALQLFYKSYEWNG